LSSVYVARRIKSGKMKIICVEVYSFTGRFTCLGVDYTYNFEFSTLKITLKTHATVKPTPILDVQFGCVFHRRMSFFMTFLSF
jgi:hypothetical protein